LLRTIAAGMRPAAGSAACAWVEIAARRAAALVKAAWDADLLVELRLLAGGLGRWIDSVLAAEAVARGEAIVRSAVRMERAGLAARMKFMFAMRAGAAAKAGPPAPVMVAAPTLATAETISLSVLITDDVIARPVPTVVVPIIV
jgi:hypothetical protein